MKHLFQVLLVSLLLIGTNLSAQFNFKAGLNLGYLEAPVENEILQRYNAANTWLSDDMERLGFVPGMEIGVRQRINFIALEASMRLKYQNIRGKGTEPTAMELFERKLSYSMRTYSLGMDVFIGQFLIGGTIDYNRYQMRDEQTNVVEPVEVVKENALSHHLHIGFEFEANEVMSVRLQPYAQFFWKDINVFGLEQNFFPETTNPSTDFSTRPFQFGLMLVFYNGYH